MRIKPPTDPVRRKTLLDIWDTYLLPNAIPALAGCVLGIAMAFFIVEGPWYLAIALAAVVPGAIMLNKYPLGAFMIWFILMPLLPFKTVSSSVFWILHRALMPLAMGLCVLSRLLKTKKHTPMQLGWADLSMIIYLALGAASAILTGKAPLSNLYELYDRMFVPFTAYWLMRLVCPTEQDLKRVIHIMTFLCITEIGVGLWARYVPQTLPPVWRIYRMGTRMSGTFTNPTPYAFTLITCTSFMFYEAMNCKKFRQTFLILTFGAGLLCIFLTFTRGCWGAALVVLLGLFYLYPKPVLALGAIALPVILILTASVFTEEVTFAFKRLGTQDTVDSRVVLAHAGKQMFYAKPILGWGFGNYDRYDWQFMDRVGNATPTYWDIKYGTSHNTYLTILAEMGATGFFFQFLPLFWWLIQSFRAWSRMPRQGFWSRKLLVIMWLPIIFFLISGQVVDMRYFWYHIGVWWLMLGLIGSIVQPYLQPPDSLTFKKNGSLGFRGVITIFSG
ncbi:MAG: O-antigen ligase family protein [Chloroflexi bacterium]|nr:O-antigen ligase family protein [Chloroflexota bacterium]